MRNEASQERSRTSGDAARGSGGVVCLLFALVLICAFWLGAMLAGHTG